MSSEATCFCVFITQFEDNRNSFAVSSHCISTEAPEGLYRLLSIYRIRDPTQEAVFQNAGTVSGSVKLTLSEMKTGVLTRYALYFHRQLAFSFCCLARLKSGVYKRCSEQVS